MYKLKLQPIGPYFFGTERGYGPDNAAYFATSRRYPQQSTVLGMLRYRLLEMRGWLFNAQGKSDSTPEERRTLIGPRSFRPGGAADSFDFGAIRSLSPVWTENKEGLLLPGPLDRDYSYSTENGAYATLLDEQPRSSLPTVGAGFDYKNTTSAHLRRTSDRSTVESDKIFKESQRIGIIKDRPGDQDKAFFKQQNYQFADARQTYFVCYVDMEATTADELMQFVAENPLVTMGGERSVFRVILSAESMPDSLPSTYLGNDSSAERWVLSSDAYIPQAIQQQFDFAVSTDTFFRGLVSGTGKTTNYAALNRTSSRERGKPTEPTDDLRKSAGFPLLRRGSVLYPPAAASDDLARQLLSATRGWHQVGYNRIVRIRNGQADLLQPSLESNSL